jgi:hypothetical protein
VGEILLSAVASAVYPLLLAIAVVAIGTAHPRRLLAGFLVGGLLASMTVSVVLVHVLQSTSFVIRSDRQAHGWVPLVVGAAAILLGIALTKRRASGPRREPSPASATSGTPGWVNRLLDHGALLALAAGLILNIVPGPFLIVGITDIAALNYSLTASAGILLGFCIIMYAFIEVPLVGFLVAPERTADLATRSHAWLQIHMRQIGRYALFVMGVYLIIRGIATLV